MKTISVANPLLRIANAIEINRDLLVDERISSRAHHIDAALDSLDDNTYKINNRLAIIRHDALGAVLDGTVGKLSLECLDVILRIVDRFALDAPSDMILGYEEGPAFEMVA